ncbi:redox-regulated ATPase YchF [Cardinium endosymbiont of Culicoides punctatus]|uniref:redox-regulated ATPase YchF n=1 Tax=Cardinium endosymbiont of Culicoides punctatus TaxID=2304601 RepID=UPI001058D4F2|nr:redox-regulated ATPase YchF [Cardinium endosymbiont of Culicoides punctatus]TDG95360.1 Ribosome-binding ATPase YchF [Cardinium endosymbiont of Culicoides punctatus]
MALKCGIVGLPNVGKSMLFNALSNGSAASANFPFCTIEPNLGVVAVPDERMSVLATLANSKHIIPTSIEFVDIAGLVQGAHSGEGLGNKFLGHIREVDAIVHVIRCFKDDNVVHVAGSIDPAFDKQIIDHELRCKDIDSLTKRLSKVEKLAKTGSKPHQQEYELLNHLLKTLEQDGDIRNIQLKPTEQEMVQSWQLLTSKPVIYFANVDEATLLGKSNAYLSSLKKAIAEENAEIVIGCAALEVQFNALDGDEKQFFLEEYKLTESGLDKLIRSAYELLRLITYFTVGPQEVRAWTIEKGTKAPEAAGVIHSDFQRGFIKAEVISFQDYKTFKNENACREAGKLRIEGKDYMVQDGDVMLFRFNV